MGPPSNAYQSSHDNNLSGALGLASLCMVASAPGSALTDFIEILWNPCPTHLMCPQNGHSLGVPLLIHRPASRTCSLTENSSGVNLVPTEGHPVAALVLPGPSIRQRRSAGRIQLILA